MTTQQVRGRRANGTTLVPTSWSKQRDGLIHWWTGINPVQGRVRDHVGNKDLIRTNLEAGAEDYSDAHVLWKFGGGPDTLANRHGDDGFVFPDSRVNGDQLIEDGDPFTVALWYQNDSSSTLRRALFSRGRDGYGGGWSIRVVVDQTTSPHTVGAFVVTTSGGATSYGGYGVIGIGQYAPVHVAVRWEPGVGLSLFVNGVLDSTWATTSTALRSSTWGAGISYIGGVGGGSEGYTASGAYPDMRLYRKALSAAEISTLYAPATRWELYPTLLRRLVLGLNADGTTLVYAYPSSTVSAGSWTPINAASLHAATADSDDTTLARSSTGAASDTLDLGFPAMGTPGAGTVTFYVRHRRTP